MTKNLITRMNSKLAALRAKNDVTRTAVENASTNEQKADLTWL